MRYKKSYYLYKRTEISLWIIQGNNLTEFKITMLVFVWFLSSSFIDLSKIVIDKVLFRWLYFPHTCIVKLFIENRDTNLSLEWQVLFSRFILDFWKYMHYFPLISLRDITSIIEVTLDTDNYRSVWNQAHDITVKKW